MAKEAFSRWTDQFRRDAIKDDMALLRTHLERIGLPDEPEKLIEGTIVFMSVCCAYLGMDGRSVDDMLAIQQYRPNVDANTHYSFTFNLFGEAFGRIITPLYPKFVDLADLHDHPWYDFQMCGYSDFRIARIDEGDLSEAESDEIKEVVTGDILFDYTEDEVDIWFDQYSICGVLIGHVDDVLSMDDDD